MRERSGPENSDPIITRYLDPKLILFLESENKEAAIGSLIDLLADCGKLIDKKAFHEAIINREKLVSTGIGLGIALPHAKLPGYRDFFIAIGIHRMGLEWGSIDESLVRLIFLIGGPEEKQTEYLQLLSRLTMAIRDKERRKKILQSRDVNDIIALF